VTLGGSGLKREGHPSSERRRSALARLSFLQEATTLVHSWRPPSTWHDMVDGVGGIRAVGAAATVAAQDARRVSGGVRAQRGRRTMCERRTIDGTSTDIWAEWNTEASGRKATVRPAHRERAPPRADPNQSQRS